jgi:hypothetical protein
MAHATRFRTPTDGLSSEDQCLSDERGQRI